MGKRFIKNLDIFGHKVDFNFDKKGSTHNTKAGGFCTIFYFTVCLVLMINNLLIIVSDNDTSQKTYVSI